MYLGACMREIASKMTETENMEITKSMYMKGSGKESPSSSLVNRDIGTEIPACWKSTLSHLTSNFLHTLKCSSSH